MLQILSHSPRLLAAACWVSCVSRISSEEKRAEMPQSVLQCFSREHAEELSKLHTEETIFGSPRPDRHDITLPWIAELSAETRKIYCVFAQLPLSPHPRWESPTFLLISPGYLYRALEIGMTHRAQNFSHDMSKCGARAWCALEPPNGNRTHAITVECSFYFSWAKESQM